MTDTASRGMSLSTKLGAIGAVLLMMALASIGLTLWVTWQLEGGAAAVNEAGRMRMQTWRLAQTPVRAAGRPLAEVLCRRATKLAGLACGLVCWFSAQCCSGVCAGRGFCGPCGRLCHRH